MDNSSPRKSSPHQHHHQKHHQGNLNTTADFESQTPDIKIEYASDDDDSLAHFTIDNTASSFDDFKEPVSEKVTRKTRRTTRRKKNTGNQTSAMSLRKFDEFSDDADL